MKRKKIVKIFSLFLGVFSPLSAVTAPNYPVEQVVSKQHLEKAIDKIDPLVEQAMEDWQIPGLAIAVIHDGKLKFAKGYGFRDLEKKLPVTTDTVFQIGSISKGFTSTLTAMHVDENLLNWDDKVQKYLPDFQLHDEWVSKNFSVEDLFSQKSGLPEKAGDMQALLGFSGSQILYNLRFMKPKTSFRKEYSYQNIFFLAAAKLLETKTKTSFKDLLQKRILNPLNMKDTVLSFDEYLKKENRASFYSPVNNEIKKIPDETPALRIINDYLPAGGVHSSVKDLAKWVQFQIAEGQFQEKNLLSKKQMRRLRRPQIFVQNLGKKPSYYALGWNYTQNFPKPFIWHNGETFGIKTIAAFIPQEKLGIVVLTNLRGNRAPEGITWDFFDAYFGKKFRNWTKYFYTQKNIQEKKGLDLSEPYQLNSLKPYIGTYQNEIFGEATIKQVKDDLVLLLGPQKTPFFLKPQKQDQFGAYFPLAGFKADAIQFRRNTEGKICMMSFDLFSEEGSADFEKSAEETSALFGYL